MTVSLELDTGRVIRKLDRLTYYQLNWQTSQPRLTILPPLVAPNNQHFQLNLPFALHIG